MARKLSRMDPFTLQCLKGELAVLRTHSSVAALQIPQGTLAARLFDSTQAGHYRHCSFVGRLGGGVDCGAASAARRGPAPLAAKTCVSLGRYSDNSWTVFDNSWTVRDRAVSRPSVVVCVQR